MYVCITDVNIWYTVCTYYELIKRRTAAVVQLTAKRPALGVASERTLTAQWPWVPCIGQNLQPFSGNDYVYMCVKNFQVRQKSKTSCETNKWIEAFFYTYNTVILIVLRRFCKVSLNELWINVLHKFDFLNQRHIYSSKDDSLLYVKTRQIKMKSEVICKWL